MSNVAKPLAEFRPSLLRLLARRILVAIVLAALLTSIFQGSWLLIVFIVISTLFVVEALYFTPPDPSRYLIRISSQEISGPTTNRHRITLPLDKIDVVKSQGKRNLYQSIYNIRQVQTNDGEKVLVYCDAYPNGAFDQMLEIISDLKNDQLGHEQNAQ